MTIEPQLINGASFSLQMINEKSSIIVSLYVTLALSAKAYQDVPNAQIQGVQGTYNYRKIELVRKFRGH